MPLTEVWQLCAAHRSMPASNRTSRLICMVNSKPTRRIQVASFLESMKYSCSYCLTRPSFFMHRSSCCWLTSVIMALVLAFASPVSAVGHHGDGACQESAVEHQHMASVLMGESDAQSSSDPSESETLATPPCCMPCAQCVTAMSRPSVGGAVSVIPFFGSDLGTPSGPPEPFERPPRA